MACQDPAAPSPPPARKQDHGEPELPVRPVTATVPSPSAAKSGLPVRNPGHLRSRAHPVRGERRSL